MFEVTARWCRWAAGYALHRSAAQRTKRTIYLLMNRTVLLVANTHPPARRPDGVSETGRPANCHRAACRPSGKAGATALRALFCGPSVHRAWTLRQRRHHGAPAGHGTSRGIPAECAGMSWRRGEKPWPASSGIGEVPSLHRPCNCKSVLRRSFRVNQFIAAPATWRSVPRGDRCRRRNIQFPDRLAKTGKRSTAGFKLTVCRVQSRRPLAARARRTARHRNVPGRCREHG